MTALKKSWNKENFAYFMEMGTGKTKVLIDNLAMLYDKGKVDGALIIAPKGVINTLDLPVPISIKYAKYGLSHDNSNAFT